MSLFAVRAGGRPGDDDDDDDANGRVYGHSETKQGGWRGGAPEKKHYSRKTHFFLYQKVPAYLEEEHACFFIFFARLRRLVRLRAEREQKKAKSSRQQN